MASVAVLNGARVGETISLQAVARIGQAGGSEIQLTDEGVSWEHARLFQENGSWWIEDRQSTNGTYLNCSRVERAQLHHEDVIYLGRTHLLFLEREAPHAMDPPSELFSPTDWGGDSGFK